MQGGHNYLKKKQMSRFTIGLGILLVVNLCGRDAAVATEPPAGPNVLAPGIPPLDDSWRTPYFANFREEYTDRVSDIMEFYRDWVDGNDTVVDPATAQCEAPVDWGDEGGFDRITDYKLYLPEVGTPAAIYNQPGSPERIGGLFATNVISKTGDEVTISWMTPSCGSNTGQTLSSFTYHIVVFQKTDEAVINGTFLEDNASGPESCGERMEHTLIGLEPDVPHRITVALTEFFPEFYDTPVEVEIVVTPRISPARLALTQMQRGSYGNTFAKPRMTVNKLHPHQDDPADLDTGALAWSWVVEVDINRDGFLDLFVCDYTDIHDDWGNYKIFMNNMENQKDGMGDLVRFAVFDVINDEEVFSDIAWESEAYDSSWGVRIDADGDGLNEILILSAWYYNVLVRFDAPLDPSSEFEPMEPFYTVHMMGDAALDRVNTYFADVVDYDGDGMEDIFLYNSDAPHTLVLNNGCLEYCDCPSGCSEYGEAFYEKALPPELRTDVEGYSVSADFNNDGFIDIYLAHSLGYHEILFNDGNANFNVSKAIEDPWELTYYHARLYDVQVIDYNADGFIDIYLGYDLMPNLLLRNDGHGNFTLVKDAGSITAYSERTWELRLLDVDSDGYDDILSINYDQKNTLHLNDGNGTFHLVENGALSENGCSSTSSAFVDLNGDGLRDLVVGDEGYSCGMEVFFNAPILSYWSEVQNEATREQKFTETSLIFDANGDGIMDIFDANAENTPNSLFVGDGEGKFHAIDGGSLTEPDVSESEVKLADISAIYLDCDQDGDNDVFINAMNDEHVSVTESIAGPVREHFMQLHINDGSGKYHKKFSYEYLLNPPETWLRDSGDDFSLKIKKSIPLDANNDGKTDIFIIRKYFRNSLLINEGNCTFTETFVDGTINSPEHSGGVVFDVDNDGDQDVFVVGFGFNNMYINDGYGNFTRRECGVERGHPKQFHNHALAIDVDNDGDTDLVVGEDVEYYEGEHHAATLYINDGSGVFTVADGGDLSRMEGWTWEYTPFDMDNDGDIDIYVTSSSYYNYVLLNDGFGYFHHSQTLASSGYTYSAKVFDMDDDGDMDLYVSGYGPSTMYTNCGKGFTGTGNICYIASSPHIREIFPTSADTAGGTNLIAVGTNLLDVFDPTLYIDDIECQETRHIADDTWLCQVPPGSPGATSISAESIDRDSDPAPLFTYNSPVIQSVQPAFIYRNTTSVTFTIVGSNFGIPGVARSIFIGKHECANVTDVQPHTSIECTVTAQGFFSDFERQAVNVTVNTHTATMSQAVCHKLNDSSSSTKCLCGVGRSQIDGLCTVCPDGEFNLNSLSENCQSCPAGATCTGGSSIASPKATYSPLSQWRTLPGYWVSGSVWNFCSIDDPSCFLNRVEKCASEDDKSACPGGPVGTCGLGYDSTINLCGRCVAGYSRDAATRQCQKCSGRASAWIQLAGIITGILIFLYIIYFLMQRLEVGSTMVLMDLLETHIDHPVIDMVKDIKVSALSGLINIIAGYLQVIGQSLSIFSIDFPAYLSGVFDVLSWFTLPVFSFVGAQCFAYFTTGRGYDPFLMGFSFKAILPWFIAFFYFVLYMFLKRWYRELKPDLFVKIVAFLLTYVHPSVSATMFQLYNCQSIYSMERGKQEFLDADPGIECFESSQWQIMAVVTAIMFVCYVIAWPVGIFLLLTRLHRDSLKDDQGRVVMKQIRADHGVPVALDENKKPIITTVEIPCTMLDCPKKLGLYGGLYNDFKDRFYWFQSYEIMRRLIQTAGVVVISTLFGEKYELPYACVVAGFFGIVHSIVMPFKYMILNYLQLLVLGGQAMTYFLLYSYDNGVGDQKAIDLSVLLIQACLGLGFIVLLYIFLAPGFREEFLPMA